MSVSNYVQYPMAGFIFNRKFKRVMRKKTREYLEDTYNYSRGISEIRADDDEDIPGLIERESTEKIGTN